MNLKLRSCVSALAAAGLMASSASSLAAVNFEFGSVEGTFTNTFKAGFQVRTQDPDPSLKTFTTGDANFDKGDIVSSPITGIHELELLFPNEWALFGRFTWLTDPAARNNNNEPLLRDAEDTVSFDPRLLDLFVDKSFELNEQPARARMGNQVVNWGESLFFFGGINYANNPIDIWKANLPGTQIKELLIPVPMLSLSTGLTEGMSTEVYYQVLWQDHRFPPVGTFWSTSDLIGDSSDVILNDLLGGTFVGQTNAKNSGQWGASLRYQLPSGAAEFGMYYARYHEKFPWFEFGPGGIGVGQARKVFSEDIDIFGASFNTDLGNWSLGGELTYRPKEPAILEATSGCENCVRDEKRITNNLTAVHLMNTGSEMGWFLNAIGAQTGTILAESFLQYWPDLVTDGSVPYDAGGTADPADVNWAYAFEINASYEGTLLPGWNVTPAVFFQHNVKGNPADRVALVLEGAKSVIVSLNFNYNPTEIGNIGFGLQYGTFFGGNELTSELKDRDFVGLNASYTF